MSNQTEVLKKMYELNYALLTMSDDEFEIFAQTNRHLIESLIELLES